MTIIIIATTSISSLICLRYSSKCFISTNSPKFYIFLWDKYYYSLYFIDEGAEAHDLKNFWKFTQVVNHKAEF